MRAILVLLSLSLALAAPPGVRKDVIHIPVWVQAGNTPPGKAATADDFKVTVGGLAAKPAALLGPDDDLLLIVVTDLAGDLNLAQIAKRALGERIDKLPPNAMVGLLRAQDGIEVLAEATLERPPVKAAIEALTVSGKAGLLETIVAAGSMGDAIQAKAKVRVAVLFVTDSDVANYREDFTNPTINWSDSNDISRRFRDGYVREKISKLDAVLAGTETPVFVVHLAYRTDTLNQAYQTGLSTLAATTGGASWFCRSEAEVSSTIGKVFDAIGSHYSLLVPLAAADSSTTVNVVVESPGRTLSWRSRFLVRK